jgi:hypothetical protein
MDTASEQSTESDHFVEATLPTPSASADSPDESTGQGESGLRRTGMARYEIYVEKSEQPLAAEEELSKAMALAAAATASFGLVKIFSEKSHHFIATYTTNRKGEAVLV